MDGSDSRLCSFLPLFQWFDFSDDKANAPQSPNITHALRSHTPRFFVGPSKDKEPEELVTRYSIPDSCIYQNSHFGYVYCLLLGKVPNIEGEILFSGSGEGDIKVGDICEQQSFFLALEAGTGVKKTTASIPSIAMEASQG